MASCSLPCALLVLIFRPLIPPPSRLFETLNSISFRDTLVNYVSRSARNRPLIFHAFNIKQQQQQRQQQQNKNRNKTETKTQPGMNYSELELVICCNSSRVAAPFTGAFQCHRS